MKEPMMKEPRQQLPHNDGAIWQHQKLAAWGGETKPHGAGEDIQAPSHPRAFPGRIFVRLHVVPGVSAPLDLGALCGQAATHRPRKDVPLP